MRISDKMITKSIITNIGKNREHMHQLQAQAASQKRINKPSDDPLGLSRVLASRESIKNLDQNSKNLQYALSFLRATDRSLENLSEVLISVKSVALSQANDPTSSAETRRMMSIQVVQAFQHALQIANGKFGSRFIFGGFKTTHPPFDHNGVYYGDSGTINLSLGENIIVPLNLSGESVFGNVLSDDGWESSKKEKRNPFERAPIRSVFKVMKNLEIVLNKNDTRGIQRTLVPLDELITQVISSRSQIGAQMGRLDSLSMEIEKSKIDQRQLISKTEDVDLFDLMHQMNTAENTLKATLDTSGRLVSRNLMDFLK